MLKMNSEVLRAFIIAILSSTGFFSFLQFMITRYGILQDIKKKIDYIDQGNVRLQLLLLMSIYPERTEEIVKLAKKYFCDFHGNYYLTTLFKKYLDDKMLIYPDWFNVDKE